MHVPVKKKNHIEMFDLNVGGSFIFVPLRMSTAFRNYRGGDDMMVILKLCNC